MPRQYRYVVHEQGPALWSTHKPLTEVLELKDTTPRQIWESTYQGNPTPPEGTIFLREWWLSQNRYDINDSYAVNKVLARWISWDTGLKDEEDNAYTSAVVGELLPDYRLVIREVFRARLIFPALPDTIRKYAAKYSRDGKLRGVIIEDKASGTSAYQTVVAASDAQTAGLFSAFLPTVDKITRAQQAAVWCANGSVLLPFPDDDLYWLFDFEDELFNFPGSIYKDQVDAFSQLILWTENLLSAGYHARNANKG